MPIEDALKEIGLEFQKQEEQNKALAETAQKEKEDNAKALAELQESIRKLSEPKPEPKKEPLPLIVEDKPKELNLEDLTLQEHLDVFKQVMQIVRGQEPLNNTINEITDPKHLESSSFLTESQVDALEDLFWFIDQDPIVYGSFTSITNHTLKVALSKGGFAIFRSIDLVGVTVAKQILQRPDSSSGSSGEPKNHFWSKRKEPGES